MERFHKLGITILTLQKMQMWKTNTQVSVCSLQMCLKEQREMTRFLTTFVGFLYHQSMQEKQSAASK